jgi:hypothetical protein
MLRKNNNCRIELYQWKPSFDADSHWFMQGELIDKNKGVKIILPWTMHEDAHRMEETRVKARIKTYLDPFFRRHPGDCAWLRFVQRAINTGRTGRDSNHPTHNGNTFSRNLSAGRELVWICTQRLIRDGSQYLDEIRM